ncbi:Holliday junction DNA helicase RuvA [Syntrophotalea acetylenivorans]|uniref:Holliday junction branch migration complex subunit RuvA n=1 Tax=Syntrophotalea acetylenivorans TaxID=1842532 RepID=A0A1L3GNZ4_9BACT|nr:Holliday junction branch migration protein RuvA [Syntrophotalea acetylenivorans]APG27605.1 Holliday junction DNA helicase RuvA [Syntrophotalea acetylenivorans]
MIALLSGNIVHKSVNQIIVDVNGVGYRLLIPLSSFYSLPEEGAVRLHVHTHVREDAISLFGFLTLEEKEMFVLLLTISGVGPKLALNILSNIPVNDLKCALTQGNIKQLSSLPGIGKKTAERLVLELKEKIPQGTFEPAAAGTPATMAGDQREDALSALVNLGYKENLSKKALDNLEIPPEASLEETLKAALKILMR